MDIGTNGHLGVNVGQLVMSLRLRFIIELAYHHQGVMIHSVMVPPSKKRIVFCNVADLSYVNNLKNTFSGALSVDVW